MGRSIRAGHAGIAAMGIIALAAVLTACQPTPPPPLQPPPTIVSAEVVESPVTAGGPVTVHVVASHPAGITRVRLGNFIGPANAKLPGTSVEDGSCGASWPAAESEVVPVPGGDRDHGELRVAGHRAERLVERNHQCHPARLRPGIGDGAVRDRRRHRRHDAAAIDGGHRAAGEHHSGLVVSARVPCRGRQPRAGVEDRAPELLSADLRSVVRVLLRRPGRDLGQSNGRGDDGHVHDDRWSGVGTVRRGDRAHRRVRPDLDHRARSPGRTRPIPARLSDPRGPAGFCLPWVRRSRPAKP